MLENTEQASPYTLALILGIRSPFYLTIAQGAQAEADAQGVTLLVDAPEDFNATLQATIVDKYVAQKVDALIIAPCDDQELIAPLQRADAAGIKVITVDAYIGDGDYVNGPVTFPLAYIGSDNRQGGQMAARALLQAIGGAGTVFIQSTRPGLSATDLREAGFKEVLAESNGAVILEGSNYDGGSIQTAAEQTSATIRKYPSLAGIFSTGDYSTQGVVQGLQQMYMDTRVKVVRFDASAQAIVDLRNGIIDAIVAQLPQEMGKLAVQHALRTLQGEVEGLEKHVKTGLLVIDRANVDTPQAQSATY
ncbi:MAG TPA: ABC transporter substrate-binding protein [Ktedonobacteraceae bacterium]|nr:ABC transporter substrate-binding protein [Ktedonobacteraceae bacterium]